MKLIYPKDKWILQRMGEELEGLEGRGTYFINYALYDETQPRPHGAWFTHLEDDWKKKFDEVASKVDYTTCQNKFIYNYLKDKVETHLIYPGHDDRVKKTPVFGWNGRTYKSGRKGEDLIEKLEVIKGDYDNAPEFYKKIDYLIVSSRIEGGPMCVIDAIAAGVPVIAREGLGWCDEFPCIRYKDDEDLFRVVDQLTNPPNWKQWRQKHQSLFSSMK